MLYITAGLKHENHENHALLSKRMQSIEQSVNGADTRLIVYLSKTMIGF